MKYLVRDEQGQDYAIEADFFEAHPHGVSFYKEEGEEAAGRIRVRPIAFVPTKNLASIREESNEILPSR